MFCCCVSLGELDISSIILLLLLGEETDEDETLNTGTTVPDDDIDGSDSQTLQSAVEALQSATQTGFDIR